MASQDHPLLKKNNKNQNGVGGGENKVRLAPHAEDPTMDAKLPADEKTRQERQQQFLNENHNSRPRQLVFKEVGGDEESGFGGSAGGRGMPPRLVKRDRAFFQSSNKLDIQHNQGSKILRLLKHNWFHAFLRWPTFRSAALLWSFWTGSIILFALLYVLYDHTNNDYDCRLGPDKDTPINFGGAFAFSLETCTTVGYGLPNGINSYFEKCQGLQVIIYFQMAWSMVFNAFLITFLYNRLGRSENRGAQVVYSKKALVSLVDGQVRFQLRIFDVDARRPVVEAHVRMYVVMKERPVPRPLRILQPNDDLGGMLFLSFPTMVSHHIDLYSLLHPPSPSMSIRPHGLVLRQVDGWTANRDDVICPICGEAYGSLERLRKHVRYSRIVEAKDDFPVQNTHLALNMDDFQKLKEPVTDLEKLQDYFRDNVSEVIAVVEGIDPITSGTFQSLHSYRFEDIVWDSQKQFAPCMEIVHSTDGRYFQVDLDRYHDMTTNPDPPQEKKRQKQSSLREGDSFFSTNTLTVRKAKESKHKRGSSAASVQEVFQSPNDTPNESEPKNNKHRRGASASSIADLFKPLPNTKAAGTAGKNGNGEGNIPVADLFKPPPTSQDTSTTETAGSGNNGQGSHYRHRGGTL